MSQVILKLQSGGSVNSSITIGNNVINKESFNNLFSDEAISKYLTTKNVDKKDIEPITNWVHQLQDGINNNKIKYDGNTAKIYDSSYAVHDDLGKKYQSIALGIIKDFSKNATLAIPTTNKIKSEGIESVTDNTKENTTTPKFQFGFLDNLKKVVSKGNPEALNEAYSNFVKNPSWDIWKQAYDSYKDYIDKSDLDFSDTTFKNKETYQKELSNLGKAISNKDVNAMSQSFNAIGEPGIINPISTTEQPNLNNKAKLKESSISTPIQAVNNKSQNINSKGESLSMFPMNWNKLNTNQKLDLVSFGLDAASLGASFIPGYGNLASGGLGLLGTTISAINGKSDFLGTLGNVGLDITGMIPGLGITAKGKKLINAAKILLPVVSASMSSDMTNAVKEISEGKFTPANLAIITTSLAPAIIRNAKSYSISKKLNPQVMHTIRTAAGNTISVTPEELSKITAASNKVNQQNIIKNITGETVELRHNLNNPLYKIINRNTSRQLVYPELVNNNENISHIRKWSDADIATGNKTLTNKGITKKVKSSKFGSYKDMGEKYISPQKNKDGGVIKAQTGVKTSATWSKDMDPLITPSILFGLNQNKDLYKQLNNLQDSYYGIKTLAGNNFEKNSYQSPNVGKYQTEFNNVLNGLGNTFAMKNLENANKFTFSKNANTNDKMNTWNDNLFSGMTNIRYLLGKKGDFTPEQEAQRKSAFAKEGYNWYLDYNNMYKLKPINPIEQKLNADLNSPISMGVIKPTSIELGENVKTPWYNNLTNNVVNHFGTLRFLNNLWYNSRIKPNYVGSYQTPVEYNSKVMYDLPSQMAYNQQAAETNRVGARTVSADQTINTANMLEHNKLANELQEKGQLANKRAYDQSLEQANKISNINTENRIQAANKNAEMNAEIQNAKESFRLAQSRQINDNFDNFLQEVEKKALNNKEIKRNIDMQAAQHFYSTRIQNALDTLQNAEQNYKISNPNKQWLNSQEYLNAKRAYDTATNNLSEEFYQSMHNLGSQSLSPLFKKGGSLSEATQMIMHNDNEFNKMMRFKVSEFDKMVKQLSNFSTKLIFNNTNANK